MNILLGIIFLMIIIGTIRFISNIGNSSSQNDDYNRFEEHQARLNRILESNSISLVEKTLSELEQSPPGSVSSDVPVDDSVSDDIFELRDHLQDLKEDEWYSKADDCLQTIIDNYESIIGHGLESFQDVELLFQARSTCLRNLKKYYRMDPSRYGLSVDLHQYMKDWFESEYDSCMDSYELFESRLSKYTDPMKPVLFRKKKLFKILEEYFDCPEAVKRVDFFKTPFNGYSEKEIKCCYRTMLKKNQIVEIKKGNRVYVSLSDNELEKRGKRIHPEGSDGMPLGVKDIKKITSSIPDKYQGGTFPHFSEHSDRTEERRWYGLAGHHLEMFRKYYRILNDDHPGEFDGDLLLLMKNKCIDEWQSYFAIDLQEYQIFIYLKRYMRFWMGNEYDPCMEEHYALERKLLKQVQKMRPEQVRQQDLQSNL